MKKQVLKVMAGVVTGVLVIGTPARGADNFSEAEVHVLRGLSERQNTVNRFNTLAAKKGSTELVRMIAQKDMEEHAKWNEEVAALAKKVGITGVGGMPAGGAPGAGAPAGAPPTGAAPQGMPPQGDGMQAGAPGMGAGGPGAGGPGGYAARYLAELEKLSGAEFDEKYLLRSLQYHEDMERTLNGQLRNGVNADIMAWAKSHIDAYEQHATLIQRVLFGEVTSIKADQSLGSGMRNDGPGSGAPVSGLATAPDKK